MIAFAAVASQAGTKIEWDGSTGRAVVQSGRLELIVETKNGLNARSLRDTVSGQVYADCDYVWPGGALPASEAPPKIGAAGIDFRARLGDLEVEQRFMIPKGKPGAIVETISIHNPGRDRTLETADFKCGFAKILDQNNRQATPKGPDPGAEGVRLCPIPYRRETSGQIQDFSLFDISEHESGYSGWAEPFHPTKTWGAEGWVWDKGASSLLVAKYNPSSMEWSLLEPLQRGDQTQLRFAGAGQWKHGSPEASTNLRPGQTCTFGETLLQAVDGDWKQAYYAYRDWTESKGCTLHKGYDPPVQWNELYDNQYFFKLVAMIDPYFAPGGKGFCPEFYDKCEAMLRQYYSLDIIKGEAEKAKELGCQALYLDPGWDEVGPGLHIWDATRLGPMDAFVKMLHDDYGLRPKVSLWCSLAGMPPTYGDPTACPLSARVIGKDGKPADLLVCVASPGFLDTKEKRLDDLCKHGAGFLMFDSDQYTGP
ncbi:MAG TPA: hypothetical protein VMI31_03740, partial [Fimbriimonadaceae bacterium]|nr:hypothetical protein [Fimbriimonadaceae bacterium]